FTTASPSSLCAGKTGKAGVLLFCDGIIRGINWFLTKKSYRKFEMIGFGKKLIAISLAGLMITAPVRAMALTDQVGFTNQISDIILEKKLMAVVNSFESHLQTIEKNCAGPHRNLCHFIDEKDYEYCSLDNQELIMITNVCGENFTKESLSKV